MAEVHELIDAVENAVKALKDAVLGEGVKAEVPVPSETESTPAETAITPVNIEVQSEPSDTSDAQASEPADEGVQIPAANQPAETSAPSDTSAES